MSVSEHLRARRGLLAVSAGALLWGTTGVAVQIIHERTGLGALTLGCLRLAVAALALLPVLGRAGLRRARAALHRNGVRLVLSGAVFGAYQALYFLGVQDVGVSVSTLVSLALAPVALTIAASVTRRRRPGLLAVLTLVAAVAGLALISLRPGTGTGGHTVVGLVASVASGLGYAFTVAVNRRMAVDGDPLVLTATTSSIGAIVLLPFAVGSGLFWPSDGVSSGWLLYIGVVPTVFAYLLLYVGLRTTSAEAVGVLTLFEPLTAAVLAAIVLHERLSTPGVIGGVLMLAAIAALYVRGPDPLDEVITAAG